MKSLNKILEGKTFRDININLLIISIGFVAICATVLYTAVPSLLAVFLGSVIGFLFGINLIIWLVKADEYLENKETEDQNTNE